MSVRNGDIGVTTDWAWWVGRPEGYQPDIYKVPTGEEDKYHVPTYSSPVTPIGRVVDDIPHADIPYAKGIFRTTPTLVATDVRVTDSGFVTPQTHEERVAYIERLRARIGTSTERHEEAMRSVDTQDFVMPQVQLPEIELPNLAKAMDKLIIGAVIILGLVAVIAIKT